MFYSLRESLSHHTTHWAHVLLATIMPTGYLPLGGITLVICSPWWTWHGWEDVRNKTIAIHRSLCKDYIIIWTLRYHFLTRFISRTLDRPTNKLAWMRVHPLTKLYHTFGDFVWDVQSRQNTFFTGTVIAPVLFSNFDILALFSIPLTYSCSRILQYVSVSICA